MVDLFGTCSEEMSHLSDRLSSVMVYSQVVCAACMSVMHKFKEYRFAMAGLPLVGYSMGGTVYVGLEQAVDSCALCEIQLYDEHKLF